MGAPCPPMSPVPEGYAYNVVKVALDYHWWLNAIQDFWDVNFIIPNLQIGSDTTFAGAVLRGGVIGGNNGGITFKVNDTIILTAEGDTLAAGATFKEMAVGILNNGYNKFTLSLYHLGLLGGFVEGDFTCYLEVYYFGEKPAPPTVTSPSAGGGGDGDGGGFDLGDITTLLPLFLVVILIGSLTSVLPRRRD